MLKLDFLPEDVILEIAVWMASEGCYNVQQTLSFNRHWRYTLKSATLHDKKVKIRRTETANGKVDFALNITKDENEPYRNQLIYWPRKQLLNSQNVGTVKILLPKIKEDISVAYATQFGDIKSSYYPIQYILTDTERSVRCDTIKLVSNGRVTNLNLTLGMLQWRCKTLELRNFALVENVNKDCVEAIKYFGRYFIDNIVCSQDSNTFMSTDPPHIDINQMEKIWKKMYIKDPSWKRAPSGPVEGRMILWPYDKERGAIMTNYRCRYPAFNKYVENLKLTFDSFPYRKSASYGQAYWDDTFPSLEYLHVENYKRPWTFKVRVPPKVKTLIWRNSCRVEIHFNTDALRVLDIKNSKCSFVGHSGGVSNVRFLAATDFVESRDYAGRELVNNQFRKMSKLEVLDISGAAKVDKFTLTSFWPRLKALNCSRSGICGRDLVDITEKLKRLEELVAVKCRFVLPYFRKKIYGRSLYKKQLDNDYQGVSKLGYWAGEDETLVDINTYIDSASAKLLTSNKPK